MECDGMRDGICHVSVLFASPQEMVAEAVGGGGDSPSGASSPPSSGKKKKSLLSMFKKVFSPKSDKHKGDKGRFFQ
eukprot:1183418-Prorocentrum_minimum.AAC.3